MALNARTAGAGLLALAAVAGLVWMLMAPEPVPVDTAAVSRGPMEVTVNADGTTRIREVYEVSAPVGGRALRSPVKVGDAVTANDTVVAVVRPGAPAFLDLRSRGQAEAAVKEAEAALALAETEIARAEADRRYAETQLDRIEGLFARGTAPARQLEDAQLAVEMAEAQLAAARAARDMRQSELDRQRAMLIEPSAPGGETEDAACCIRLTAPVTGHVLDVVNESARMVQSGTPLLTLGRLDDLEITADLLSTDAVRIAPGARAYVERWGGEGVLEAELREIEPAAFTKVSALGIEEQRVRVVLDFRTPPAARATLGHGYRVYLRIVEWQSPDALRLPISALFRSGADWAVFVARDGVAERRVVRIGKRNSDMAEVLDGLEPGERVVTHPGERVADGVRVIERADL